MSFFGLLSGIDTETWRYETSLNRLKGSKSASLAFLCSSIDSSNFLCLLKIDAVSVKSVSEADKSAYFAKKAYFDSLSSSWPRTSSSVKALGIPTKKPLFT